MEILLLFVVFERQTNEVSGWGSLSMKLTFSENEAFVGEALVLGEISFLILLSLELFSDFLSLTLKTYFYSGFPREQTFPISYPITDHFIIFYYFLIGQPIKSADLLQWEEYHFHISNFNRSSNQALI